MKELIELLIGVFVAADHHFGFGYIFNIGIEHLRTRCTVEPKYILAKMSHAAVVDGHIVIITVYAHGQSIGVESVLQLCQIDLLHVSLGTVRIEGRTVCQEHAIICTQPVKIRSDQLG